MSRKQIIPIADTKKQQDLAITPKSNTVTAIDQYDETVKRLWHMYQEQVNRNLDLMAIINRQQEMFGKSLLPENTIVPISLPEIHQQPKEKPVEEKQQADEPLTFAMLRKFTEYFCQLYINPFRRMDALHNMLQLLYNLYQMDGRAEKEELFTKSGVADPTGFRIMYKLKQIKFVYLSGTKFSPHYQLTDIGRQFLTFKLTPEAAQSNTVKGSAMYRGPHLQIRESE